MRWGCPKRCGDIKVAPKRDFHGLSARCVILVREAEQSQCNAVLAAKYASYRITLHTRLIKMRDNFNLLPIYLEHQKKLT